MLLIAAGLMVVMLGAVCLYSPQANIHGRSRLPPAHDEAVDEGLFGMQQTSRSRQCSGAAHALHDVKGWCSEHRALSTLLSDRAFHSECVPQGRHWRGLLRGNAAAALVLVHSIITSSKGGHTHHHTSTVPLVGKNNSLRG